MEIRPAAREGRVPALDGLRAVAVGLVMAYHGGVPGLRTAGFYGVDVFFVLSGFLITTLLLNEESSSGKIGFRSFWGRRARRLLPGLLLMLVAVDLYVAQLAGAGRYPAFRSDALSVIAYVSNWHFAAGPSNYFQATGFPSLLTHTWSLAIEEQFYLLWPLVLWGAVRLGRRTGRRPAAIVMLVSSAGAIASAGWMAALHHAGVGPSRLYYGTDSHAQSILIGAALAGLVAIRPRTVERMAGLPIAVLAGAGLIWAATHLGYTDPLAYQGGFFFVGLMSAVLIGVAVTRPAGSAARFLSISPLVYLGRISYGMYLWYFPLFEVLDHARTGLSGPALFAVRCAADVAVAAASFHLVEEPVRRWRPQVRPAGRRHAPLLLGLGAVASVAALVVAETPAAFSVAAIPSATAQTASPTGTPGGLRILVVGDSTGYVLGLAMALVSPEDGIVVDDRAILGCGVVVSGQLLDHEGVVEPPAQCHTSTSPDRLWPAILKADMASFRPDVVLLVAGRWEVKSRRTVPSAPWTDITEPGDAAYVRSQLDLATSIALAQGTRVALATAPCFSSGEQPDGNPWPDDSPQRVQAYNRLVTSVVATHRDHAYLVDLNAMVCPGGRFRSSIDGVTVRSPDGVHYPFFSVSAPLSPAPDTEAQVAAFGHWITPRILAAFRPNS